ncbi:delta-12 fatty acid desaturase [Wallemia mellicola]|nr:delta-12 fatty acid desaturase [Wallemia mellicola]
MVEKFAVPEISIKDLLNAIPADCFKRSSFKSSLYVVQDVFLSYLLIKGSFYIPVLSQTDNHYLSLAISSSLWALFWFAQGLVWTGIWVIAHECGHQAYSTSKTVNNTVGFVLHSFLLVPYHSWRISHGKHHAATGHMSRDQVFVPKTRSQRKGPKIDYEDADEKVLAGVDVPEHEQLKVSELLEDAPLATFVNVLLQQLLGWPMYLIRNASGQRHYPRGTNHFNPSAIIFDARHFGQIVLSDLGVGLMLGALYYWGKQRGFAEVVNYYVIPYLWVNNWLVCITFLQHTDPSLPHYREGMWNFQRGALCTIDRTFMGPIGKHILHGICETHVAHHISSKIPHYNAWKATDALKAYLGPHYHYCGDNVIVSLFKNYRNCVFVEDKGDIVFYKDARGRASRVADTKPNQGFSDSGIEVQ